MNWHTMPYRVIFSDTDAGGIVYHAHYFEMAERGRNELLRDVGMQAGGFQQFENCGLVLRNAKLRFTQPAFMDDLLTIMTRITSATPAKTIWDTKITCKDRRVCDLTIEIVCVDSATKAVRYFPDGMVACFKRLGVNTGKKPEKVSA